MESGLIHPRLAALPRRSMLGLEVPVASGPRSRLLGLAGLSREAAGPGLLIPRCSSVHTFGMRFALDLVFLDASDQPLAERRGVTPRRFAWHRGTKAILEIPAFRVPGEGGTGPSGPWEGVLPQREEIASVVVCEDDDPTRELLCENLTEDRFAPLPAPTAAEALRFCRFHHPDLMLLDLTLPDASGLDVLREIRAADGVEAPFDPHLPVIVLSGRGAHADRVRGLDLGADDYLRKPVNYIELRARIGAVLRRRGPLRDGPNRVGDLVIDALRRRVTVGGRAVELSKKEFALLRILATDPRRVFTKEELLHRIWGFRDPSRTRTLDSHASRLRRKLDPEGGRFVLNTWGVGYRLVGG